MATRLPKQQLDAAFEFDAPSLALQLPDGTPFEGNKKQYFDALMGLQYQTSAKIAPLVEVERACRAEVMALLYPNGYPTNTETGRMDGTDKYELPGGWTLVFEKRVGCKIDEAQLPSIRKAIAELPVNPETGEVPTLGDALRYRIELSDSAYGLLDPVVRTVLNEALTFTPGTPGVKIEAPKAKAQARAVDQKANPL